MIAFVEFSVGGPPLSAKSVIPGGSSRKPTPRVLWLDEPNLFAEIAADPMRRRPVIPVIVGLLLASLQSAEGGPPLIELQLADQTLVGKSLAHDQTVCWLAQADGLYTEVPLADVTAFRKVEGAFRPRSSVELRNQLRRDLGHGWEVAGTAHYLVCARNQQARTYAEVFEELYGGFRQYFRTRGFALPDPEFPLVAVVYPNVQEFAEYCRADGLGYVPGLKGYYRRTTNRVILYDPGDATALLQSPRGSGSGVLSFRDLAGLEPTSPHAPGDAVLVDAGFGDASIPSDLRDTLIHEGTHQIAYNLGLHNRIGEGPRWVIEGLATMFEPEGARQNRRGGTTLSRVNTERFEWFRDFVQRRRTGDSLARFVADDQMFMTSALDAYSQAWALTFFLAETRPSQYTAYLKLMAGRDPLTPYGAKERLADFQQAFGSDLSRLEVSFLRFIDGLD